MLLINNRIVKFQIEYNCIEEWSLHTEVTANGLGQRWATWGPRAIWGLRLFPSTLLWGPRVSDYNTKWARLILV